MMINKLLSFFILFLFTGCSTFSADSDSISFEAKIGSKSFKADAIAYPNENMNAELWIVGRKGEWENSENINFGLIDFNGTLGEYQVRQPSYYGVSGSDVIIRYTAFDSVTSSVTITKYDESLNQIKGNFAFEVIVERPFNEFEAGEKIMIEGNFDAKIKESQFAQF